MSRDGRLLHLRLVSCIIGSGAPAPTATPPPSGARPERLLVSSRLVHVYGMRARVTGCGFTRVVARKYLVRHAAGVVAVVPGEDVVRLMHLLVGPGGSIVKSLGAMLLKRRGFTARWIT